MELCPPVEWRSSSQWGAVIATTTNDGNENVKKATGSTSFPGSLSYPSRDPGWVWSRVSQNLGDYKQTIWRRDR